MKFVNVCITVFVGVLGLAVLAACGGSAAAAAAPAQNGAASDTATSSGAPGGPGFGGPSQYQSAYLTNTYANALPATIQLTLGTMQLEGSPNAVTAAEAKQQLPLYQALKGNALQNQAEVAAVYKQIEGTMTPAQMQAIAGLKLTRDNLATWAQANGITLFSGTPGAPGQGFGQGGQGGQEGQGGTRPTPDTTRVALRAELQNLSPDARATRLAQLGFRGPPGGGQNRGRFMSAILDPLIKLLTQRAGS